MASQRLLVYCEDGWRGWFSPPSGYVTRGSYPGTNFSRGGFPRRKRDIQSVYMVVNGVAALHRPPFL